MFCRVGLAATTAGDHQTTKAEQSERRGLGDGFDQQVVIYVVRAVCTAVGAGWVRAEFTDTEVSVIG